ncbi:hypothetical protein CMU94_01935 [Elizabethkingia anophelis]|nr:hypothetical protein [Elizabethkingia anophelis]
MGSNRYRLKKDEEELLIQYRTIKQKSQDLGIPIKDVKHGWLKNKETSMFFKNPLYDDGVFNINEFDFEKAFKNIKPISVDKVKLKSNLDAEFDQLVISDIHIGMDASDNGRSLYNHTWTKDDIFKTLDQIVAFTIQNQKSNVLYIKDLGDMLDGFNGQTTRGGHNLPQNMTNEEAFDVGFEFKVKLIESLLPYYDKIHFHNINNDNHSGSFAYCLNKAFEVLMYKAYSGKVTVVNQLKFIDYSIVGNYCFITTHGKDSQHMKHGFKPKIDPNQINKIIGYLTANNLLNKGYDIIVEKGDSHQYLFDSASSDLFKYYNYPALSPSSNWVQTNFQKGQRGFIFFNYYENRKAIHEYFF